MADTLFKPPCLPADAPCAAANGVRRHLLATVISTVAMGIVPGAMAAGRRAQALPHVTVFKGPACTCCEDWIATLRKAGFEVSARDEGNAVAHARVGLPTHFSSCHTALIDGYAIEGHVPVREIKRLLKERPEAIGLAVPGMPVGTPGMDGPEYGGRRDPYDVLLIGKNGKATVYRRYARGA